MLKVFAKGWLGLLAGLFVLTACQNQAKATLAPLAIEQFNPTQQVDLCAQVEANWNSNWKAVIAALEVLVRNEADCSSDQPSRGKLYAAHYNFGAQLQSTGAMELATEQYQAALLYRPDGQEALAALGSLGVASPTPPPLESCTPAYIQAAEAALPPYQASEVADFVEIEGRGFAAGGIGFVPKGINYFPQAYPWRRFLTEANLPTIERDFKRLREVGFNSLRLFVWHQALFQCEANGAIPLPEAFARLDSILQLAGETGFRVILTLNDLPDQVLYPLYDSPPYTQAQLVYLVERYREERAIMAWDVRNEGDIDYRREHYASQEKILAWLKTTTVLVRQHDAQHLITAGWLRDELTTEPYVDFLSFHFWEHPNQLEDRLQPTLEGTDKPVLMEEFGYSTAYVPAQTQAELLLQAIQQAEGMGAAGWLIWTAYDYPLDRTCVPPACPSQDNAEHHFGLWQTDDTPKPAVELLQGLLLGTAP